MAFIDKLRKKALKYLYPCSIFAYPLRAECVSWRNISRFASINLRFLLNILTQM